MFKYGDFSGPYFSVFSPNTGKYGSEKNSIFGHLLRGFRFCIVQVKLIDFCDIIFVHERSADIEAIR